VVEHRSDDRTEADRDDQENNHSVVTLALHPATSDDSQSAVAVTSGMEFKRNAPVVVTGALRGPKLIRISLL
jgi:hypothetical protein